MTRSYLDYPNGMITIGSKRSLPPDRPPERLINIDTKWSKAIRIYKEKYGLRNFQIAEKVGVTTNTVSTWLVHGRIPSKKVAMKLEEIFKEEGIIV